MSVLEQSEKPECMAHFPDGRYRWLALHDHGVSYGHAAIAERGDDLELHVSLTRWGPAVRRRLQGDVAWLKGEAGRLGLKRILGVRADSHGGFDAGLFRFAKLYGFTDACVVQTVALSVVDENGGGAE